MKISRILVLTAVFMICGCMAAFAADPDSVIIEKERGLIDWTENYIEATGMAVAPKGMQGRQERWREEALLLTFKGTCLSS